LKSSRGTEGRKGQGVSSSRRFLKVSLPSERSLLALLRGLRRMHLEGGSLSFGKKGNFPTGVVIQGRSVPPEVVLFLLWRIRKTFAGRDSISTPPIELSLLVRGSIFLGSLLL